MFFVLILIFIFFMWLCFVFLLVFNLLMIRESKREIRKWIYKENKLIWFVLDEFVGDFFVEFFV